MSSTFSEQKSHPLRLRIHFPVCFLVIKNYHYDTCRLCYFELIFWATFIFQPSIHLSVFSSSFNNKFTPQFTTAMHIIFHSLAQRAPPATCTWAVGNYIMSSNLFQPVPLPQVIFIPPHHQYHQHLQLQLRHKHSLYPKIIIFETSLLPCLLSLRLLERYLYVMSRKTSMSLVLLVSPTFELQRQFGRAGGHCGAGVQFFFAGSF
jgi:hypothetical protein